MLRKLLFCFSVLGYLLSACKYAEQDYSGQHNSNSVFTVDDFESLCKEIENKNISAVKLHCMFIGKYDSSTANEETVYTFVLDKNPEAIDTCWGVISYDNNSQLVKKCGLFCQ